MFQSRVVLGDTKKQEVDKKKLCNFILAASVAEYCDQ